MTNRARANTETEEMSEREIQQRRENHPDFEGDES
jgi:hypothetical protein